MSEKRGSNPRPQAWEACALPTELLSLASAKLKLYDIISLEIERKRPFFVDNDFFENKYALGSELFYISILERDVKEWRKFSEIDSAKNNLLFLYTSNI